jgi:hypothetical protein
MHVIMVIHELFYPSTSPPCLFTQLMQRQLAHVSVVGQFDVMFPKFIIQTEAPYPKSINGRLGPDGPPGVVKQALSNACRILLLFGIDKQSGIAKKQLG